MRMAEDRLPCCRSESMSATSSDKVMPRPPATSFSPFQNASSRLTLVLWPAITIERLTTGDFIDGPLFRPGADRGRVRLSPGARLQSCERDCADQKQAGWRGHVDRAVAVCPAFERS